MDNNLKEKTLVKVARILNENNIIWAIGGSFLLYVKGVTNHYNDFDIMISENDINVIIPLLKNTGVLKPQKNDAQYRSNAFIEYTVDGVDFDLIAGFTIIYENKEHYFPLIKENITDFIIIDGISIPLQSLGEWKTYYSLIGKSNKVKAIERFINE